MRQKHSDKFKKKIVGLKLAGGSAVELGEKYEVAPNLIHKWAADPRYAKPAKPAKAAKTIAAKIVRRSKADNDVKVIVAQLMKGWQETLEGTLGALVDVAVKRKLDSIDEALKEANESILEALKRAS